MPWNILMKLLNHKSPHVPFQNPDDIPDLDFGGGDGKAGGKKKLSVERIYQKKTQLEHILLRPDTYIGSTEPVTQVSKK